MADNLELPLQMPAVPEGFCQTLGPDWLQQIINLVGQGVAILQAGGTGVVILNQPNTPDVSQRGMLWRKTGVGSRGIIFQWDGGAWISPNPTPSGGIERRWVEGTPNQIWLVDGGDGSDPATTPPSDNVGAMWEIDTNYAGRVPIGVGAIPGSDPAKNLALSENYGAGSVTLDVANLPAAFALKANLSGYRTNLEAGGPQWLAPDGSAGGTSTTPATEDGNFPFVNDGGGVAHQNTPAGRGGYWIKRTARINYVG